MVGLAKLVIAPGCGPGGRGFESHISPQKKRKGTEKRTSHKDVRKYPMKSRLRVAKQEKCNMDDRSVLHFFVMCPHLKICAAINKE